VRVSFKPLLGLASKLTEEAEKAWYRIRGSDKIGLLLSGVTSKDGIQVQDNPPVQQKLAGWTATLQVKRPADLILSLLRNFKLLQLLVI
jgi:hypothetical protein